MKRSRSHFSCLCLMAVISISICQDSLESSELTGPQIFEVTDIPLAMCTFVNETGSEIVTPYDVCTSFCCGGFVVDNSLGLECCGSVLYGRPYDPSFQKCCAWWTGHGRGHVRSSFNFDCCGTESIIWGPRSCCYGFPDPPEVFDHQRELCCNSKAVRLSDGVPVRFGECCGQSASFDRRFQSCPCGDGIVLDVVARNAGCCETPEGLQTPFLRETQICCPNGEVGNMNRDFCCGEFSLGTVGDSVCCSGTLVSVEPRNENFTECCVDTPFDPNINLCCGGMVMPIIDGADQCCAGDPYNATDSVCCQEVLFNREIGTECCGTVAFSPDEGNFCCGGNIFIEMDVGGDTCCGTPEALNFYFIDQMEFICCNNTLQEREGADGCCGSEPVSTETTTCCDGQIFSRSLGDSCCNGIPYTADENHICCNDGPFGPFRTPRCCTNTGYDVQGGSVCCGTQVFGEYKWPACCVDEGYDAFTHVCCRAVIFDIPNGGNQGDCCGPKPYDRTTQMCCFGENITIPEGIPRSRAECCSFDIFNNETQLCCAGVIREKTNQFTTRCCGTESYNTTENICCTPSDGSQPVLNDFEFGMENTACCGRDLYNNTEQFCCEGVLMTPEFELTGCCAGAAYNMSEFICCNNMLNRIGNVPIRRAACCGNRCMYDGLQRCCNNRIYQANVLTNSTCSDF